MVTPISSIAAKHGPSACCCCRNRRTSPAHYAIEPLFTRDPAKIREDKILMAMMAITAVYQPYEIRRLNHGIGYATAAIELILPTFGAARGLTGKVATHFVLNPHPTLIPAIEAGFVGAAEAEASR